MVKMGHHQLRIKHQSRNNRMLRQNKSPKANHSSARFVTSTLGNRYTWRSTTFVIKEIKKSNAISAAFLPTPNMVCRSIWIATINCSPMQRNRIARYFFPSRSSIVFYSIFLSTLFCTIWRKVRVNCLGRSDVKLRLKELAMRILQAIMYRNNYL